MIFPALYNGPINYYARLVRQQEIVLEQYDSYTKQTFRNRCLIMGPNDVIPLSIPVQKISGKYFSYDKNRQKNVLREFHVEGYVNQYVLEAWDPERGKIVFRTEAIENIPPGWQARTTYEILGENAFRETFDLAGPGQEMSCFITIEFERVPGG